ncbi:uncharacterized protein B0I36DRAFT_316585 [Microdochium trichocladiopsis]|uniref:Uncharacterized protein n=1 Tax=Microdochium trichocladiopsis TaxID=1682393 RepID=A0A9P9BSM1_9PEZI|nr:uncharacterized protein B0I36DRAFT_316585 [Microdochium trichocladiopsis]KAH7034592.1 hypothetical protein B0I36DRAFT_316585 [Microdochium trichocladiopsis]
MSSSSTSPPPFVPPKMSTANTPQVQPPLPSIVMHSSSSSTTSVNTFPTPLYPPPAPRPTPHSLATLSSTHPTAAISAAGRSLTSTIYQPAQVRSNMPLSNPQPTLRSVPSSTPSISYPGPAPGGSRNDTEADEGDDNMMAGPKSAVAEAGFIPIGILSPDSSTFSPQQQQQQQQQRPGLPARIDTSSSTQSASGPPASSLSPCSDDDGFTPVTPGTGLGSATSPRTRRVGWGVAGAGSAGRDGGSSGLSPRDALGIPLSKILRYASFRNQQQQQPQQQQQRQRPVNEKANVVVDDDDEYEDVTPLTPRTPGGAPTAPAAAAARPQKSVRQTLFGLVEGWWDLGLLERGKSLRRGGGGGGGAR